MASSTLPERLNLSTDLIKAGAPNRSGRAITPTYLTIHNTANASRGADAHMHAQYLKGSDAQQRLVSWHFTVDDKRCVQHLPLHERGMHAGTGLGNASSIGIEICEHAGIDQAAANQRAALLTAALLRHLDLAIAHVVPHQHWSGKRCPHLLLDSKGGISGFLKLVKAELATLPATATLALATHDNGNSKGTPAKHKAPARAAAPAPTDQLFALDAEGTSLDTVRSTDCITVSLASKGKKTAGNNSTAANSNYLLDARPDTLDFRDILFTPTLREVPAAMPLSDYQKLAKRNGVPVLDQGREGACTGFALATVANFLLGQRAQPCQPVSARMLYDMARRYDEWEGEGYEGSSARGAIKGWHKHGVCAEQEWPSIGSPNGHRLTGELAQAASRCPLGAYFRVNHKDLVCMHNALAEVGVLYATGIVHDGWEKVDAAGRIEMGIKRLGGHAFAIVGYDEQGFWLQNSWGPNWGKQGFAHLTYDDWLAHGTDVWVVRLGVPLQLHTAQGVAAARWNGAVKANAYGFSDLRPHVISLGNDGGLRSTGTFGNDEEEVRHLLLEEFPAITKNWKRKRLLIYAHGGLVSEDEALQRVAEYRVELLKHEVYPLAIIWKSDLWTTLTNLLQDAQRRRRPEGFLDGALDFVLDRLDDFLEPVARNVGGRSLWEEMKENGQLATLSGQGGLRLVLHYLMDLVQQEKVELHLVSHSAGAIVLAPFAQLLTTRGKVPEGPMAGQQGFGQQVASCTFWAPAITTHLFMETYAPAIVAGTIGRPSVFALHDAVEQDDHCANVYHKSLLYLVSNAFETATVRQPFLHDRGTPLLGMAKFVLAGSKFADQQVVDMIAGKQLELVLAPNIDARIPTPEQSASRHHGDFDDDELTVKATLARILGPGPAMQELEQETAALAIFRSGEGRLQQVRQDLPAGVGRSRSTP
ncbi:Papain family cysteine protease [Hymenobacter daecheongensis DSM 21074]|uniref:N-acetylmuramoyl-L-alanine amidase n=1 Tax=Hymenobacter daecheongensis DSM 21074 TaxID=1121955 RepID=A0A1M6EIL1_9BACT|nr:N-acetylmuramoyl-L-alanine amidase [Hymenobacter daecheongensis]SHI85337.1 Papain family cysteine protease [Hymenobacter daecheongensis DSM 21074]